MKSSDFNNIIVKQMESNERCLASNSVRKSIDCFVPHEVMPPPSSRNWHSVTNLRFEERKQAAMKRRLEQQERLLKEKETEQHIFNLFDKPEKVFNDNSCVSSVLGDYSNAQQIINSKSSCIGIDYQPPTPALNTNTSEEEGDNTSDFLTNIANRSIQGHSEKKYLHEANRPSDRKQFFKDQLSNNEEGHIFQNKVTEFKQLELDRFSSNELNRSAVASQEFQQNGSKDNMVYEFLCLQNMITEMKNPLHFGLSMPAPLSAIETPRISREGDSATERPKYSTDLSLLSPPQKDAGNIVDPYFCTHSVSTKAKNEMPPASDSDIETSHEKKANLLKTKETWKTNKDSSKFLQTRKEFHTNSTTESSSDTSSSSEDSPDSDEYDKNKQNPQDDFTLLNLLGKVKSTHSPCFNENNQHLDHLQSETANFSNMNELFEEKDMEFRKITKIPLPHSPIERTESPTSIDRNSAIYEQENCSKQSKKSSSDLFHLKASTGNKKLVTEECKRMRIAKAKNMPHENFSKKSKDKFEILLQKKEKNQPRKGKKEKYSNHYKSKRSSSKCQNNYKSSFMKAEPNEGICNKQDTYFKTTNSSQINEKSYLGQKKELHNNAREKIISKKEHNRNRSSQSQKTPRLCLENKKLSNENIFEKSVLQDEYISSRRNCKTTSSSVESSIKKIYSPENEPIEKKKLLSSIFASKSKQNYSEVRSSSKSTKCSGITVERVSISCASSSKANHLDEKKKFLNSEFKKEAESQEPVLNQNVNNSPNDKKSGSCYLKNQCRTKNLHSSFKIYQNEDADNLKQAVLEKKGRKKRNYPNGCKEMLILKTSSNNFQDTNSLTPMSKKHKWKDDHEKSKKLNGPSDVIKSENNQQRFALKDNSISLPRCSSKVRNVATTEGKSKRRKLEKNSSTLMPPPTKNFLSYLEEQNQDDLEHLIDISTYMQEAKCLKHKADKELDREGQAMKYIQAVLYFILCGLVQENRGEKQAAFTMYKETLSLVEHVCRPFRNCNFGSFNNKLAFLSLRCQSIMYLKLYKMCRHELKECQKIIGDHIQKANYQPYDSLLSDNGGTLSPTPSPADSEGSVCSKSSGYTSSNEASSMNSKGKSVITPPTASQISFSTKNAICMSVPHIVMQKQHQYCNYLTQCHELWEMADIYANRGNCLDFTQRLNETCGPLTLHSSLKDLVKYTQSGLDALS